MGTKIEFYNADGKLVTSGGGAGGGAPTTATYITQTPDATLTNEQALSSLSDGLLRHVAGVVSSIVLGAANRVLGVNAAGNASEYKDVLGTTKEIEITHAANSITLGLPNPVVLDGVEQNIMKTSTTLTIATGAITVVQQYHLVDTEAAAASDDLDTISGGVTGEQIVLRAANTARTVVIKHGTGNIQLNGASDFSLDDTLKALALFFDGTNWLEMAKGAGSAGVTYYQTFRDDGTDKTQRGKANFTAGEGTAAVLTDDAGNDETEVKVSLDIPSLVEDTTPVVTTDYVVTYDASAAAHKKVLLNNLLAAAGGVLFYHVTDVPNGTTVETDLYSDTLAAAQFAADGDTLEAVYGGLFVGSATATRQIRIYFAGNLLFDTGAANIATNGDWRVAVTIIRESATVIRCVSSLNTGGASTAVYTVSSRITGLTLSGTNVLKITGQAAGAGAASNDIIAEVGFVAMVNDGGSGGGGGAPTTATYITQTSDGTLSNEQALNSLSDGLLKHASGVVAQAVSNTDYVDPTNRIAALTALGLTSVTPKRPNPADMHDTYIPSKAYITLLNQVFS